ncbi:MAG: N-6 DNA methylase, partial [Verrucomicrobiota bacterium]
MTLTQLEIPGLEVAPKADATHFFSESSADSRGEVFTKREVVEFILDLTGWKRETIPEDGRLLEPSCGTGEFLVPAINRLLDSSLNLTSSRIADKFVAVEVNMKALQECRHRVKNL